MREGRSWYFCEIAYRAFYVLLLYGICVIGFGGRLGVGGAGIWVSVFALCFLGSALGISYGHARGKLVSGIFMLLLPALGPVFAGAGQVVTFWLNYGRWLVGGMDWNPEWMTGYEMVQSCFLILCCYLFQVLSEKLPWVKGLSAFLLLGNLVWCMLQRIEWKHVAVVPVLWYVLLCFIEMSQHFWKKKKSGYQKEYVLRLMPFCLLYLLLLSVTPAPKEPYDWRFVKEAYSNIREKVTIWLQDVGRYGQEDFASAQKGFSGDGRLLGGLADSNRQLLTIQGNTGLKTNIYLTGKIYDTFDGRQWMQTYTEAEEPEDYLLDTLETLYAIKRYDQEDMEDYVYGTGLSVRYEYFHTGCVFAPLKTQRFLNCAYQSSGTNLVFERTTGYGTEYKLTYLQLNVDHPAFYEMAGAELTRDEEAWESTLQHYLPRDEKNISLEELEQYQERMKEIYGTLPVLSAEVSAYLTEVTKGSSTNIEKLLALEEALSRMTYTEQPGMLPDSVDSEGAFLDYFLLETGEGYCSYFATAFVLLAREEGIPARYVEGFCVPMTENKRMTVTSEMAHAWPEVYLEGIGWIPFEPTPGYEELRYTPWKLKSDSKEGTVFSYEEEAPEEAASVEETEEEAELIEMAEKEKIADGKLQLMLFILGAAFLTGCILLLLLERFLGRRKYHHMNLSEQFEVEVKCNLWLLSSLGIDRNQEETIAELQERAVEAFEQRMPLAFLTYYEEYRYGECEITADILNIAVRERQELLLWIKQARRWYYYLIMIRLYLTMPGLLF